MLAVLAVIAWFAIGALNWRVTAVAWETEFGEGTTGFVGPWLFLLGPLGVGVPVFLAGGNAWRAALMLEGAEPLRRFYFIDKPRSRWDAFVLKGVTGLPSYENDHYDSNKHNIFERHRP